MERFVQLIVDGGVVLVAGLWITEFARSWAGPWLLGITLIALGTTSLLAGTFSEVRRPSFWG